MSAPLGAVTHGIELNEERAHLARDILGHTLATDAFATRLSHQAWSLLLLNPPYDYDDEKKRREHAFLTQMLRTLVPGGMLVFIIPQRRLITSARFLASHFTEHQVFRFPDPEFDGFRQIVLFARRRPMAVVEPGLAGQLTALTFADLPSLPDEPVLNITVPAVPPAEPIFSPLLFDPESAVVEAQRRGVWANPLFADQVWPNEAAVVRPLLPLRKGHLALLIAAGMLNNVVIDDGRHRILVKGQTFKEFEPVEGGNPKLDVAREQIRTKITTLDLSTGEFAVIGNHEGVAKQG